MVLALEYVIRTGALRFCLDFPTSIFIEHRRYNDKIVITITKKPNDKYSVKHWFVSRCKGQYLPSFVEFEAEDLFNDDRVVLDNYYILRFAPNPYLYGRKQYSDTVYGMVQEGEYKNYINTFYHPENHVKRRMNWLWEAFADANKDSMKSYDNPYTYPYFGYSNVSEFLETQRKKVQEKSKQLWANWNLWMKYMILDFPGQVAPELVFQKEYAEKNEKEDKENSNRILL
jgi:hypothetical protein